MAIQRTDAEYIKDVTDIESNLYLLRLVRDKVKNQSEMYRNINTEQSSSAVVPEEPRTIECKLKRIPEKPVLNVSENKMLKLCKKLVVLMLFGFMLTLVALVVVLVLTDFFAKSFDESGVWGILVFVFLALTAFSGGACVYLRERELRRYRADVQSWKDIKAQIEEYNLIELQKTDELNKAQKARYFEELELFNADCNANILVAKAKYTVFELLYGKLCNATVSAEKYISKIYLQGKIPPSFRRIDISFMLKDYIENDAETLTEALDIYSDNANKGVVAARLSDLFEDVATYGPKMTKFYEAVVALEEEADNCIDNAEALAFDIAEKATDKQMGHVNSGIISLEFQRAYEDCAVAALIRAVANSNADVLDRY